MLSKITYAAMIMAMASAASVCVFKPSLLNGPEWTLVAGEDASMVPEPGALLLVDDEGMKGWVQPGSRLMNPFYKGELSAPKGETSSDSPIVKPKVKVGSKQPPRARKLALSSMHKDLDRIFSQNPDRKRAAWKVERKQYDRLMERRNERTWSGSFPGRS